MEGKVVLSIFLRATEAKDMTGQGGVNYLEISPIWVLVQPTCGRQSLPFWGRRGSTLGPSADLLEVTLGHRWGQRSIYITDISNLNCFSGVLIPHLLLEAFVPSHSMSRRGGELTPCVKAISCVCSQVYVCVACCYSHLCIQDPAALGSGGRTELACDQMGAEVPSSSGWSFHREAER